MNDARPVLMPKARKDQLIIKELPDEILVYDQASDQAHCLNDTAALVWKSCDGNNSVSDVSAVLASQAGVPVDENVVWLALDQLEKFKLLSEAVTQPRLIAGMSRRQVMRTLGVVAIALPTVATILVPAPAHAQSCIAGNNTNCTIGGTPCCPGRTCQTHPSGTPKCQ